MMEIEHGLRQLFGEPSEGLQERVRLALDRIAADEAEGVATPTHPPTLTSPARQGQERPAGRLRYFRISRAVLVAALAMVLVLAAAMVAFALNGSRIIELLSRGDAPRSYSDDSPLQEGAGSLVTLTEAVTLRFDVAEVTLSETLNDGEYLHFALQVQPVDDTVLLLPGYLAESDRPMSSLGPRFKDSQERLGDYLARSGRTPYLIDISRPAIEIDNPSGASAEADAALMEDTFSATSNLVLSYESDGSIIVVGSFRLPSGSASLSGDSGTGADARNLDLRVSLTPAYLAPATGALLPEGTLSLRQAKSLAVPVSSGFDAQLLVNSEPALMTAYGIRIDELRLVNTPTGMCVYLRASIADRGAYDAALAGSLEAILSPEQLQGTGAAKHVLVLPTDAEINLDDGAVVLPAGSYSGGSGVSGDGELLYAQFILPAQERLPTSVTFAFRGPSPADPSLTETVRIELEPAERRR
ncbi:MAG: hypothetical protein LBC23_02645 [Coriobacteriales bacterium]|jgi:hypothetical protein|nr:hypothetical protein [Coriobacteriales bacterium]